jgi:peptide/nickel transport system substrate-binding protein
MVRCGLHASWCRFAWMALGTGLALGAGAVSAAPSAVTVHFTQEPDNLNPYVSTLNATGAIAGLFWNGLLMVRPDGGYEPELSVRVPTLENGDVVLDAKGMHVTYRLRRGVVWHDGRPLCAQDVVATYQMLMHPKFPALSRAGYERIAGMTCLDARTVVVHFKTPYAPYRELFPYVLSARHTDAWQAWPIGTGPYCFRRRVSGDRIVASANVRHFRGRPGIERVVLRFVPHDGAALMMWQSGDVDVLQGASPAQWDHLRGMKAGAVSCIPTPVVEQLVFNLTHPILGDRRVRQAIAYLVDRHELSRRAYSGVCMPAYSELPPSHWAHTQAGIVRYERNARLAEQLLDEAGFKRSVDGVRKRGQTALSLTLLTTSDRPSRALAAQLWRRQWRESGIDLQIERLTPGMVFGSMASGGRLATGTYDLALIASASRPDPDTSVRWRSDQMPPFGQNRTRYRSQAVDAWLQAGQTTIGDARRKPIYHAIARQLNLDLPALPLLYWMSIDAVSPRVSGFSANANLRGNLWNIWQWTLKQPGDR